MSDVFKLIGTLRPAGPVEAPSRPGSERTAGRPAGDPDARQALDRALARLDGFLRSGQPPRADAARGTYLNVLV
jgi:hypothetical protein